MIRAAPPAANSGSTQAPVTEDPSQPATTSTTLPDNRIGELVTVPAGKFLMGDNGSEGFGTSDELPQHWVDLPTYEIGKYEVMRGQYRKFMEAGGYADSRYWSAEGWKWKESDVSDYAGMHGKVARTVRPHSEQKRSEPEHWEAEQEWVGHGYDHPRFTQTDHHPVVGVTYCEAEAYCKWAGGRFSTIERWYHKASAAQAGPIAVLQRKIRSDQGQHPALSTALVTQLPAPPANRLIADIALVFRTGNEERTEQRTDVLLRTNEVVTVGPLQVGFTTRPPNPFAPTNQPAIRPQAPYWLASFLPRNDIAVASVTFFSEKSDEPILVAKNVSSEGTASTSSTGYYDRRPKSGGSEDPFSNCTGYGFTAPEGDRITIKLRYYDAQSLVEKRCVLSTGLCP